MAELTSELKKKYGVVVLGPLGFENAYALAMRRTQADKLSVKSIADPGIPCAGPDPRVRLGIPLARASGGACKALTA